MVSGMYVLLNKKKFFKDCDDKKLQEKVNEVRIGIVQEDDSEINFNVDVNSSQQLTLDEKRKIYLLFIDQFDPQKMSELFLSIYSYVTNRALKYVSKENRGHTIREYNPDEAR